MPLLTPRGGLRRRAFLGCLCCAGAAGSARAASPGDGTPDALELGTPGMRRLGPTVWIGQIAPSLWLHTTTKKLDDGTWYPCNGLILDQAAGAVMIDTANTPAQAGTLLAWSAARGHPVTLAVATHFHTDRTGGIAALHAAGIPTLAHPLTRALAQAHAMPVPEATVFANGLSTPHPDIELFHPGAGHTRDNITVWLPRARVLHGGCLVKSTTAGDLGYLADARVPAWPASMRRLAARYPDRARTIPGHGSIAGDPIAATFALLAKA